jgi:hypothetical protein
MAGALSVQVGDDIKTLRKSFKTLGTEAKPAGKMLRGVYKKVSDHVADKSQASARGSRMGHIAVASIKSRATQTSGSIQAGRGVPWFGGNEYGSFRFRQFPPVNKGGYHIYPTIAAEGDQIVDMLASGFDDLIRSVGFR